MPVAAVSLGSTSSFAAAFRRVLNGAGGVHHCGSGSRNRSIWTSTPSKFPAAFKAPEWFRSRSRQRVRPAECDGSDQKQHPSWPDCRPSVRSNGGVNGEKLTGVVVGFLHSAPPWPALLQQHSKLVFRGSSPTNIASHPKTGVDSTPRFERHHPLADLKLAVMSAPAR